MDRVQPSRLTLALVSCCLVFIWFFTSHTQPLPVTHQPVTAASPAKLAGAYHEVLHDYQQYQGKLSVLHSQNAPHFVLFTAGLHPGTDIPWCPDCASARPVVRECVRQVAGALLEVEVGTREAWRDPNHPLKCAYFYNGYCGDKSGGGSWRLLYSECSCKRCSLTLQDPGYLVQRSVYHLSPTSQPLCTGPETAPHRAT